MRAEEPEPLPPEADLALVWSGPKVRAPLSTALQLDRRLARIVSRTTEPMLGQMRLAWWREALNRPPADRPRGDVVLDAIGRDWAGGEAALVRMVDGWEVLLTAERLENVKIADFTSGRSAFFSALGGDAAQAAAGRVALAGLRWAMADAAGAVSDEAERAALVAAGLAARCEGPQRLPASLRGLAVLDALALRALQRGGRPMMEGRGAPLAALRAAIFLT
jgi:phytoene synthase